MSAREWQFDGLVGPTHNYAGLAFGNLAAEKNAGSVSNPRAAALQGLQKMRFVRDLGLPQAFVPPHFRPNIAELKRCGFEGNLAKILTQAAFRAPGLLASVYSSSFMWTANMATVTPSFDALDGKLHFTPANLASHYHRGMEADFSFDLLQRIFHNTHLFNVHNYLRSSQKIGDEGAANHMRINNNYNDKSLNVFVYGDDGIPKTKKLTKFPARQQRFASESVARLHHVDPEAVIYLQQSPEAIDSGIFHNDVISMNTTDLLIVHEKAFIKKHQELLHSKIEQFKSFRFREVKNDEFTLEDSVNTYMFNSQLLDTGQKKFVLVAPAELGNQARGSALVKKFLDEGLLHEVHYLDVRESMRNGGGPACLRLRVVMNLEQEHAIHRGILLTNEKFTLLTNWVNSYYRDRLCFDDLRDPDFVIELIDAYKALESIIEMPGLYDPAIASI